MPAVQQFALTLQWQGESTRVKTNSWYFESKLMWRMRSHTHTHTQDRTLYGSQLTIFTTDIFVSWFPLSAPEGRAEAVHLIASLDLNYYYHITMWTSTQYESETTLNYVLNTHRPSSLTLWPLEAYTIRWNWLFFTEWQSSISAYNYMRPFYIYH